MNKLFLTGAFLFFIFAAASLGYSFAPPQLAARATPQRQEQASPPSASSSPSDLRNTSPSSPATPSVPEQKMKTVSMAEVAKHDFVSNCWLAVDGKAYDATEFISAHPGGPDAIINECGHDASAAFDGVGAHSRRNVTQELASIYVADIKN